MPAGAAEFGFALRQPMRHRDPLVEDEALALPQAVLRRHLFEISEDAALEMEHVLETEGLDIGRRLFAANAAGAEHRDLVAIELVAMLFHPGREFAKARRARIDSALE